MRLVLIDQLKPGMVVAFDVVPFFSESSAPLVLKDTRLTSAIIERFRRLGIRYLYVHDSSSLYMTEQPSLKIDPANLHGPKPKPVIEEALRAEAIGQLHSLFSSAISGEIHQSSQIVRQLDTVVGQLVEALDQNAMININDLKDYDEYTYHHSLSVAVLSIAIGQHFGFNRSELDQLGKCAIMHDIGKTAVPIEIIQKPSRLSDAEFSLVQHHTVAGYEYLEREHIGGGQLWDSVLAHHEKADGTGYPNHLKGNQIPIWSRIISVADVYDALTSNRPYRVPMQPDEALEYIMGGIDSFFDYDVVSAFVEKVELYPVGSIVELSSGALALVLDSQSRTRPVVRDLVNGATYDLAADRRFHSIVIKRTLSSEEVLYITSHPG